MRRPLGVQPVADARRRRIADDSGPGRGRFAVLLLPSLLLGGAPLQSCFLPPPARIPMKTTQYGSAGSASCLCVVFLPGRGGRMEDFEKAGFPRMVEGRLPHATMIAADAHSGYYAERILVDRLHEDVVLPLREKGCERVWLAGVSMGGLGALLHARYRREDVAGLILLAPFLGDAEVIDEITAAGGPLKWAPKEPLGPGDYQRDIWRWLRDNARLGERGIPIWLGYGTDDRRVKGCPLLATILPSGQTATAPGGHDWRTWSLLWESLLASGALAGPPPGGGGAV